MGFPLMLIIIIGILVLDALIMQKGRNKGPGILVLCK